MVLYVTSLRQKIQDVEYDCLWRGRDEQASLDDAGLSIEGG